MKYTEEDLRKAYQTGFEFARQYFMNGTSDELDEDDFVESLNISVVEEDKISFTYSFLSRKLDWERFCDLTGTNEWAKSEGAEFRDNDIYYVTESKAKQFNLI